MVAAAGFDLLEAAAGAKRRAADQGAGAAADEGVEVEGSLFEGGSDGVADPDGVFGCLLFGSERKFIPAKSDMVGE